MYLEVAQTGNTDLLVISGKSSEKEIQERWEEIVKKNADANGQNINQLDNIKDYVRLLSSYIAVKASLLQLMLVVDDECIAFLASKGYQIDKSSNSAYQKSIADSLQKVKNILTKLQSKYNVILEASKGKSEDTIVQSSAESMLANVSSAMGFNVDSNVTLARYNEYNKIIKRRIDAQKENKSKRL